MAGTADLTPVQLDDNLVNGQTYTFQFQLQNWITNPSVSTLQNDIDAQAPSFLTSVQVTQQAGLGLLTNYSYVQFTYEGDGSDVVSDVANSIIAAFQSGSNDSFTFVQALGLPASQIPSAVSSAASSIGTGIQSAVSATADTVGSAVGDLATKAVAPTVSSLSGLFIPILIVAVIVFVQLGGIKGVKGSLV